jgi:hypothetical protein
MRIPLVYLLLLLIFAGCSNDPMNPDISGIEVKPVTILRLENDLFALSDENIRTTTTQLKTKYGTAYERYLSSFLVRYGTHDTSYQRSVLSFINDQDVSQCYQYVRKIYPTERLEEILSPFTDCMKRFRYHFPTRKLPARILTCTTGWNYAFAVVDSNFVIGLDWYLGDTAKFYQMLRIQQYQARKMNEHYIIPDIVRGWLLTEFVDTLAQNTLLSHTIYYGKLYYAVNALLPEAADSILIGYTGKQLDYCKAFEKKLWGYFAENNRLFENNMNTVRELTTEGPFTAAISRECPPRIAMWVGWQIVKSYMKRNKEVKLQDLMLENDAQKILTKSRYKP